MKKAVGKHQLRRVDKISAQLSIHQRRMTAQRRVSTNQSSNQWLNPRRWRNENKTIAVKLI